MDEIQRPAGIFHAADTLPYLTNGGHGPLDKRYGPDTIAIASLYDTVERSVEN